MILTTAVLSLVLITDTPKIEERDQMMPEYSIVSDTVNSEIPSGNGVFVFDFSYNGLLPESSIIYSIDNGENQYFKPTPSEQTLRIPTTTGTHSFAFFLDEQHQEIELPALMIENQHEKTGRLFFYAAVQIQQLRKPVLYVYPEVETEVSIEVIAKGTLSYTYPDIEKGWNFTCTPDGTLTDGVNSYPYLFWESEQQLEPKVINPKVGSIVSGAKSTQFLETQLTEFGMTAGERADFITYWGPVLQTKTNLYIYLLLNEDCDAFASLKINPEPSHISRIYVLWTEVPADYTSELEPQKIPKMQRDGFTVLEWGGVELSPSFLEENEL